MLDKAKQRLKAVAEVPRKAIQNAAPKIQQRFREDATTKRGNVPGYGKMGGPITATPGMGAVNVDAPGWVMAKAKKLRQPRAWLRIIAAEARALMRS